MGEAVAHRSSQSLFGWLLKLLTKMVVLVLFSAALSIALEWILMATVYDRVDHSHARSMLENELAYMHIALDQDGPNLSDIISPRSTVDNAIRWLFVDSGFLNALESTRTIYADDLKIVKYLKTLFRWIEAYVLASVYVIATFAVRLVVLLISSPTFLLFGVVGLLDGLVLRDLRKWTGEHESSFVYHWSKKLIGPLLLLTWVIYLSLPLSIHPNFIVLPFAVAFGLAVRTTARTFKKNL